MGWPFKHPYRIYAADDMVINPFGAGTDFRRRHRYSIEAERAN